MVAKDIAKGSQSQKFSFTGDDDVFVYLDGRLVMDIGGTHKASQATITINLPCLITGRGAGSLLSE